MRVYLDDVRPAPEGWVRARTPEQVIELLRSGKVEALSLDFDLGFRGAEERRTGEVVLQWIEERVPLRWTGVSPLRPHCGKNPEVHCGKPVPRLSVDPDAARRAAAR